MILFMDSELGSIKKLGEGTYGEAYRAGRTVCKVVPFDGDLLVNGETQKVHFINLLSGLYLFGTHEVVLFCRDRKKYLRKSYFL
jgi:hypothetical protein